MIYHRIIFTFPIIILQLFVFFTVYESCMNKLPRIMLLQLVFFMATAPLIATTTPCADKEIKNQTVILRMLSIMLSCQAFICCMQAKDSSSKLMFAGSGLALAYAGLWDTHPFEHQSSY